MDEMKVSCPTCGEPITPGEECPICLMKLAMEEAPAETAVDPVQRLRGIRGLEIRKLLGRGGMGQVYLAEQMELGRPVALKILPQNLAKDAGFVERFRREARVLAGLHHPNIVAVYDHGVEKGVSFLVMEYMDGVNLRTLMRRGLEPGQALSIVSQVCDALQYAHSEGIVHRDIKPENILVDKKGRVKIADFGLAKLCEQKGKHLTGLQDVMGTPPYMAPEQHESLSKVDHRADIYSLGVVFYEMLTGKLPVGHFEPPSRKVEVDIRLDEIVLKALENSPERRYQQAAEIKADVETVKMAPHFGAPAPATRLQKAIAVTVLLSILGFFALKYLVLPFLGPTVTRTLHVSEQEGGASYKGHFSYSGPEFLADFFREHPERVVLFTVEAFVIVVLIVVFWFWMLIDCLLRDHRYTRIFSPTGEHDKIVWLVLFFVVNAPAAILYFFLIKRRTKMSRPGPRNEAVT